jgi:hypothetical protein
MYSSISQKRLHIQYYRNSKDLDSACQKLYFQKKFSRKSLTISVLRTIRKNSKKVCREAELYFSWYPYYTKINMTILLNNFGLKFSERKKRNTYFYDKMAPQTVD